MTLLQSRADLEVNAEFAICIVNLYTQDMWISLLVYIPTDPFSSFRFTFTFTLIYFHLLSRLFEDTALNFHFCVAFAAKVVDALNPFTACWTPLVTFCHALSLIYQYICCMLGQYYCTVFYFKKLFVPNNVENFIFWYEHLFQSLYLNPVR